MSVSKYAVADAGYADQPTQGNALNPLLYDQLVRRFGSVIIAKPGCELVGGAYVSEGGPLSFDATDMGEYYRVNCPFCSQHGDTDGKYRLWIHHRWGVGLDASHNAKLVRPDDRFWWAAVCYHHGCMAVPENVNQLRSWTYAALGRERHLGEIYIRPGMADNASLGIVELPGSCRRVDELPLTHEACQYLLGRGFDPGALGRDYEVSFCDMAKPEYPKALAKLILPIKMSGTMVGWQARPPFEADWKARQIPKYYNCPGTNKRLMLYGFDLARPKKFCIIVEGVADVWALGHHAVAILGKELSLQQATAISNNWSTAIVALDSDAADKIEKVRNMLAASMNLVPVFLPEGLDPATIEREYFWALVRASAEREHIALEGV